VLDGRSRVTIKALAAAALLAGAAASPASATDFYAGKQIQMRIGAAAGGGVRLRRAFLLFPFRRPA